MIIARAERSIVRPSIFQSVSPILGETITGRTGTQAYSLCGQRTCCPLMIETAGYKPAGRTD